MEKLRKFFKEESGAIAVEYCLMAALIALVVMVAVTALGTKLPPFFNSATGGVAGS